MRRAALAALLLALTASGSAVSRPATPVAIPVRCAWRTWPALPPASPHPAVVAVPVAPAGARRQPDVRPKVEQKAPRARETARSGQATWFAAPAGTAAAGPALRRSLGKRWRGSVVTVSSGGRSVRVRLTDWCACGPRHGRPTLIDLSRIDFARLADPSAGVLAVSVK